MTIKEVCEKYNITQDTLRYYEKIGIIPSVTRTKGGQRDYQEEDLAWVKMAICLRGAGFSVDSLSDFVRMSKEGCETIDDRLALLLQRRIEIRKEKDELELSLSRLNQMIEYYERCKEIGDICKNPLECSCDNPVCPCLENED